MPSRLHEALLFLFRNRPELAPEILRKALSVELPEYTEVRIESAELSEARPVEYRADLVVLLLRGKPVLGIVVEVQLSEDGDKEYVWPAYMANLRQRIRCPVFLLVVAGSERVARWARRIAERGGSEWFRVLVLGPSGVPVVDSVEEAREAPELAVLSAMAHGKDADVKKAVRIAVTAAEVLETLDEERFVFYYDLVLVSLGKAARKALEAMMQPEGYEFQSDFAKRYFGKGLEQGLKQGMERGREEIVLKLLARKFGPLDAATEARVREATIAELDVLAERILTAESIDEVFSGE